MSKMHFPLSSRQSGLDPLISDVATSRSYSEKKAQEAKQEKDRKAALAVEEEKKKDLVTEDELALYTSGLDSLKSAVSAYEIKLHDCTSKGDIFSSAEEIREAAAELLKTLGLDSDGKQKSG